MRARAQARVETLKERGADARVYDPTDTSVGGIHAVFLLLGRPEDVGLPSRPEVPTIYLRAAWQSAALTGALAMIGAWLAFALL